MGLKTRVSFCAALLAAFGAMAEPAISEHLAKPARRAAASVAVVDGDTIRIDGQSHRLVSMDAPEKRQTCTDQSGQIWPCGREAAQELAALIDRRGVPLECAAMGTDRYGRTLSHCWVGDVNLSREMLRKGFAVPYGRDPRAWLLALDAWRQQYGIWASAFEWPSTYRSQARQ